MNQSVIELQMPLTLEAVKDLKTGDLVSLTGRFFTCRSKFQKKLTSQELQPPAAIEGLNVMCHMGPVMKRQGEDWQVVSAGPTTSFRMDAFGTDMIKRLNLRAIIGKGTMGKKTMETMRQEGCVHLSSIGMDANCLPKTIKRVVSVSYLEEFGMIEAVWILEAKQWGPFLVDIDTSGANYFHNIDAEARRRLPAIMERLGVDPDYVYPA